MRCASMPITLFELTGRVAAAMWQRICGAMEVLDCSNSIVPSVAIIVVCSPVLTTMPSVLGHQAALFCKKLCQPRAAVVNYR